MSSEPNEKKTIRIGSRDSKLALKQTNIVLDELKKRFPQYDYEIISMKTIGDKKLEVSLSKVGEKSLFTKELEDALKDDIIDLIVHSLKDLPTTLPEGMVIGGIMEREDPRDCVIMHPKNKDLKLNTLSAGSVIGTSSVRRTSQLKKNYPQLKFECIRGNLNTRLEKLEKADKYDAIVLAVAGVDRMGWTDKISQYLESEDCMYAVGQGALAIECMEKNEFILHLLEELNHSQTLLAAAAERAFMWSLEGGCSAPVAVWTKVDNDSINLQGGVWSLDGTEEITYSMDLELTDTNPAKKSKLQPLCGIVPPSSCRSKAEAAFKLGLDLAQDLKDKGAKKILDKAKMENQNVPINKVPEKKVLPIPEECPLNGNGTHVNGNGETNT